MASRSSAPQLDLRAKINTELENASADDSPRLALLKIWQKLETHYASMLEVVQQYVTSQLDDQQIRATLYGRIKSRDSISKSIDRREQLRLDEHKYESPKQIFADLHDLVGLRIVADYPSGLDKSYHLIENKFRIEKFNMFSPARKVGQHWKPRFGAYETRNYLVRLEGHHNAELSFYKEVLFEIQVTTLAESLYNKLAHPLHYKGSLAGLSLQDEMIIDLAHGAALSYWIAVACMEEKLENNLEGSRQQAQFPEAVRQVAGHDETSANWDALVKATPNMPAMADDTVSVETLMSSLVDLSRGKNSPEDIWEDIRNKLGLNDRKDTPISLPTVFEARFDSKDLEASPKCHPDTRTDVRQMIRVWVDDVDAETMIWLHAPAGTGKSTLARTLVNDLRIVNRLVAGYFFKRGDDTRNNTCLVFPTIAIQLIKTIHRYNSALKASLGSMTMEGIEKMALVDQFKALIKDPFTSMLPMSMELPKLIIVDALDECVCPNDIPLILKLFASLNEVKTLRLCILFSSRRSRLLINAFDDTLSNGSACRVLALHEEFLHATRLEMSTVLSAGLADIKKKKNIKTEPWPDPRQFDIVLDQATRPSPLFIYISTFLRHIGIRNPLDQVYMPIVDAILAGEGDGEDPEPLDVEECSELRQVVGSLVLLAKPLPAGALRQLLGLDEDRFQTILGALHAVIKLPADEECSIEIIHKSFADFVLRETDKDSALFRIDASVAHGQLAEQSITRMHLGLHKNLCNVDTPAQRRENISADAIVDNIPTDLQYSCEYWVHHLVQSNITLDRAASFLSKHLLHWFEALALRGRLPVAAAAIRRLLSFVPVEEAVYEDVESLTGFLRDARKFLGDHGMTIKEYPLQLYGSCLVFNDPDSRVKRLFSKSPEMRLASIRSIRGGLIQRGTVINHINILRPSQLAISPAGEIVVTSGGDNITIADIGTSIVYQDLPTPNFSDGRVLALAFLEDQGHIIAVLGNKQVYTYDRMYVQPFSLRYSLVCPGGDFHHISVAANSSLIASVTWGFLRIWDLKTGHLHRTIENEALVDTDDLAFHATCQADWTVLFIKFNGDIYLLSEHDECLSDDACSKLAYLTDELIRQINVDLGY
ncbi:hypothetical protein FSARC_13888 [Fusarium sarcochroum]|uniref:RelA/SpoT domain-containing protein n=1 Tax=Fusarium sarcochroum TaxID=1208366 RepID=A0A8H4SY85_9HYPO|nr:hypothetical protein FSARC_13888 [Fusarium sarcochroum]